VRRPLAALAAAAALAGCGGTGAELPEGAGEDFRAWRDRVERVCRDLRERAEDLPNPNTPLEGASDAEKLRRLGERVAPLARLYREAAAATAAVPLPRERADVARQYVDLFTRRARNYAEIPDAAAEADRRRTTILTERDDALARALALATEEASVRC
jgi:hypothetical protein